MAAAGSSIDLDAAFNGFLPLLDKGKKEALMNLFKSLVSVSNAGEHWDNPSFVSEMEQRYEDYKKNPLRSTRLEHMLGSPDEISLNREQKEAILNLIEAFSPPAGSHWDDPDFVAEMDRRLEDYKSEKNIASFNDVESLMDHLNKGIKK